MTRRRLRPSPFFCGGSRIEAQEQASRPWSRVLAAFDRLIAPLALFTAVYLGTLALLVRSTLYFHWIALISVVVATAAAVFLWDRGRWSLGVFVPPLIGMREAVTGIGLAVLLIGITDLLNITTTGLRHTIGGGFSLPETVAVFLPAVLHEELLFRGYPFQRLWRWKPWVAIIGVSIIFAVLHGWNVAVTPLALFNIFLGGVLLSLAYVRYERLWFPIGLHFGWNMLSGPVLGYPVSGYVPEESLLRVTGSGPELLTGGRFGLEGSVWITVVEVTAIAFLARRTRNS